MEKVKLEVVLPKEAKVKVEQDDGKFGMKTITLEMKDSELLELLYEILKEFQRATR